MLKDQLCEDQYEYIKNIDDLIFKALELVSNLFQNDKDKGGFPYIVHLVSVYRGVSTYEQKVIALLHDTIEDKNVTDNDLIEIGFPRKIVEDVVILSREESMSYEEYINNLVCNASIDALCVKVSDLKNNIDLSRIKNPTKEDYDRVENKYKPALEKVLNRLKEMER